MASATAPPTDAPEAPWPPDAEGDVIVLRFASTDTERSVLEQWLEPARASPARVRVLDGRDPRLQEALAEDGDPLVAPVRVAWLPRERRGVRRARLRDLLAARNPRRPGAGSQGRILRREPDRCRVVVAEPARVSELRARRARDGGDTAGLAEFVGRQAVLALDRAERRLFGTQYKVPRFVSEELRSSARFRQAVAGLAEQLRRPEIEVGREAEGYVDEMVASQSRLAIDAWGSFGDWLARAYTVEVDGPGLDSLRELNRSQALVFLPSHRSYLDPLVLRSALHDGGFTPNHTLGGLNVAFWPIGPVARRSGYVFIRRSFKDNPVYKLALREYMAYLLRKRFNLEWYIEGGRSRTGKLRPPRYGLLAYLVEAFRGGGVEDVVLVPTSIVYDQLYEVGAMAAEEHGAQKTAESLGWLVGYARAQGRGFGKVRLRFGEPLPLREALGDPEQTVEKVAFEVCHRINRATPITPTSLASFALLGVDDRALTLHEVRAALDPLLEYVEGRGLPLTGDVDLREVEGVRRTLDALARHGVVDHFGGGLEPVWAIAPERHLEAAFYRNAAIHFFVNRAIVELLLVRAAEAHGGDLREESWQQALRLRDLLKYEFFFARKRDFAVEIRQELALIDPDWEARPSEPQEALALLAGSRLHVADRVLRSFLEAYAVVAERLAARDAHEVERNELLDECLGVARQYSLQRRLHSPESISKELFRNALRLAANRDLLRPGDELAERRAAFAAEVGAEVRRIAAVRELESRST
jgi:glycerol-3-phosphate O-acyltransferase